MKKIIALAVLAVLLGAALMLIGATIGAVSSVSDEYNSFWLAQPPVAYPASFTVCDLSTGQIHETTVYSPQEWEMETDRVKSDPRFEFNTCH